MRRHSRGVLPRDSNEDEHGEGDNLEDEDTLRRHPCPVVLGVAVKVREVHAMIGDEGERGDGPAGDEDGRCFGIERLGEWGIWRLMRCCDEPAEGEGGHAEAVDDGEVGEYDKENGLDVAANGHCLDLLNVHERQSFILSR